MTRRDFLATSSLATGALFVPGFLQRLAAKPLAKTTDRVLVVVQLSGGNDGLNTLVPYRNDLYYQARPSLAIPATEVIKVHDTQGLHPALAPLEALYKEGHLTLLNQVGYPNPDRSHFRSMDIWHTATDADTYGTTGWLGRYLDSACPDGCADHWAIEVDDSLSLALKGETRTGFAVSDPQRLRRTVESGIQAEVVARQGEAPTANAELDFLYKTTHTAYQNVETLYRATQGHPVADDYPQSPLGRQLGLVGALIRSGLPTRVYYVSLAGFDTHVRQQAQHPRLLQQLAEALAAFQADLTRQGAAPRVTTLVFSEFGRRVAQNGSGGTDHGAGGNLWLMGSALKQPGFYNPAPDLATLDRGDVPFALDFRQVYATLLRDWLGADDAAILGRAFERLPLV
ncbi:MAG: DUF1501 domain-containing protein [Bacteroidia bacterium]|nr:DUF1501 domain-containing protein [Bacteroidia bacterium]